MSKEGERKRKKTYERRDKEERIELNGKKSHREGKWELGMQ